MQYPKRTTKKTKHQAIKQTTKQPNHQVIKQTIKQINRILKQTTVIRKLNLKVNINQKL